LKVILSKAGEIITTANISAAFGKLHLFRIKLKGSRAKTDYSILEKNELRAEIAKYVSLQNPTKAC
jgi:hypothetical protein